VETYQELLEGYNKKVASYYEEKLKGMKADFDRVLASSPSFGESLLPLVRMAMGYDGPECQGYLMEIVRAALDQPVGGLGWYGAERDGASIADDLHQFISHECLDDGNWGMILWSRAYTYEHPDIKGKPLTYLDKATGANGDHQRRHFGNTCDGFVTVFSYGPLEYLDGQVDEVGELPLNERGLHPDTRFFKSHAMVPYVLPEIVRYLVKRRKEEDSLKELLWEERRANGSKPTKKELKVAAARYKEIDGVATYLNDDGTPIRHTCRPSAYKGEDYAIWIDPIIREDSFRGWRVDAMKVALDAGLSMELLFHRQRLGLTVGEYEKLSTDLHFKEYLKRYNIIEEKSDSDA
jgi:hypothetical protein